MTSAPTLAPTPAPPAAPPAPRVHLLDELRGWMILNVVAYHALYDLVFLFGVSIPWYLTAWGYYWQQGMSGSLIFFAGMSCRYARSNLRRGAQTFLLGMLISAVTWVVLPGELIWFGILHFMGCAMMLFSLLRPALDRVPPRAGLIAGAALFLFFKGIYYGRVGIPLVWEVELPAVLYSTPFLFPLGLPGPGFASADYFPLLPWLFLFLAGSYAGMWARQGRLPGFCYHPHLPFLAFIGRHTMVIYLLHQPVIYGLLWLILRRSLL